MRFRWSGPLGYVWAMATVIIAGAVPFFLIGAFTRVVGYAGLRVSPMFTGGEVARTIPRAHYRILVYEPARPYALQRGEAFVQVAFEPVSALPHEVREDIDLDGDATPDVRVVFAAPRDADAAMRGEVVALRPGFVSIANLAGADSFSRMLVRSGDRILLRVPLTLPAR